MLNDLSKAFTIAKQSFTIAIKTPVLFVLSLLALFAILIFSIIPYLGVELMQTDSLLLIVLSSFCAMLLTYILIAIIISKVKALTENKKHSYISTIKNTIKPILLLSLISVVVQLPLLFLSIPTGTTDNALFTYENNSGNALIQTGSPYVYPDSSFILMLIANIITFIWMYFSIFAIPIIVNGEKNILTALRQSVNLVKNTFTQITTSSILVILVAFLPSILFALLSLALLVTGSLQAFLATQEFFILFILTGLSIPISVAITLVVCSISLQLIYSKAINGKNKLDVIVDELSVKQEHGAAWYFAIFTLLALLVIIGLQTAGVVKVEPDWLLAVLVILGLGVFAFAYKKTN